MVVAPAAALWSSRGNLLRSIEKNVPLAVSRRALFAWDAARRYPGRASLVAGVMVCRGWWLLLVEGGSVDGACQVRHLLVFAGVRAATSHLLLVPWCCLAHAPARPHARSHPPERGGVSALRGQRVHGCITGAAATRNPFSVRDFFGRATRLGILGIWGFGVFLRPAETKPPEPQPWWGFPFLLKAGMKNGLPTSRA